ncbi:hypothetical protein KUL106_29480 [Alteromonas sp. KUL106]|nr:hypothetical protein KUL106_29480 [Alteromonas sp. KUL106]
MMKTQSKNIFLSIALSVFASCSTSALAQETPPSLTHVKDVTFSKTIKKQRINKSLALNVVKQSLSTTAQSKGQTNSLFLIHSVLPNHRSNAE